MPVTRKHTFYELKVFSDASEETRDALSRFVGDWAIKNARFRRQAEGERYLKNLQEKFPDIASWLFVGPAFDPTFDHWTKGQWTEAMREKSADYTKTSALKAARKRAFSEAEITYESRVINLTNRITYYEAAIKKLANDAEVAGVRWVNQRALKILVEK